MPRVRWAILCAVLVAGVLIVTAVEAMEVAPSAPIWGLTNDSASSSWTLTELNLLNGKTLMSKEAVLNGHTASWEYNSETHTQNRSEPKLLKGSATSRFWSTGQPVLLMAPYSTAGFNGGTFLFPTPSTATVNIHLVAAYEQTTPSAVLGDGVSAYLFLDPTHVGNWSMPFSGMGPEVNSTNYHIDSEGNQIFPYSYTPYVIVQWDPANGYSPGFNVYLVHPEPSGAVTYLSLQSAGQLGTGSGDYPAPGDLFDFNVSYSTLSNKVQATIADPANPSVAFSLSFSLNQFGFVPAWNSTTQFYFGVGENAGYNTAGSGTSWGALKVTASGTTVAAPMLHTVGAFLANEGFSAISVRSDRGQAGIAAVRPLL